MAELKSAVSIKTLIQKATDLELAGFWRRAATQWLTVMDHCPDDTEWELITRRREQCLLKSQGTPEERRRKVRNRYRSQERYKNRY
ncbi:PerC family transcriptional regulator [Yersinia rochesterensis]|uniref:PerC family transcriptional regulator n=1 Tax=Yersinia rochesterensis TaxID=1604335 RepID=UPI0011A7CFE8|nr:PerC family transcriptional regulator [Yersinia rochesterensis]